MRAIPVAYSECGRGGVAYLMPNASKFEWKKKFQPLEPVLLSFVAGAGKDYKVPLVLRC
jgi:hypothetical protein